MRAMKEREQMMEALASKNMSPQEFEEAPHPLLNTRDRSSSLQISF
jgi:hypothetical protein